MPGALVSSLRRWWGSLCAPRDCLCLDWYLELDVEVSLAGDSHDVRELAGKSSDKHILISMSVRFNICTLWKKNWKWIFNKLQTRCNTCMSLKQPPSLAVGVSMLIPSTKKGLIYLAASSRLSTGRILRPEEPIITLASSTFVPYNIWRHKSPTINAGCRSNYTG